MSLGGRGLEIVRGDGGDARRVIHGVVGDKRVHGAPYAVQIVEDKHVLCGGHFVPAEHLFA